jgi:murein DD-endopeptidase MepM/ murein hydrolase activator NlpD
MYLKTHTDSDGISTSRNSPLMKISLFFKPSIIKVCFSVFLYSIVFAFPVQSEASFFGNFVSKVLGVETEASSEMDTVVIHNSQTVPLLESSVNPDIKNSSEVFIVPIVEEGSLLSVGGGLDADIDLTSSASSLKIVSYTVKKGDTIDGIAKKFKTSRAALFASNIDLKKTSTLKVGQVLTVVPVKESAEKTEKQVPVQNAKTLVKEEPKKVVKVENTLAVKEKTPNEILTPPVLETSDDHDEEEAHQEFSENVIAEKPVGTVEGGYIWPFPAGVGRISQGLHSDMAYDFAAPPGTPLYAIQDGTVLIARNSGYNGGYGLYVVIDFTDGRQAILAHLSKVSVKAGDVVRRGQVIGLVGSTGKSTGPHVHIGFHGELSNPYVGLKVNTRELENHD